MVKLSNDEKKWQAENDAETMARYEEIMSDSARRNAAIKAARERADDLNKRASAMSKVANNKPKTISSRSKKK